MTTVTGIDAIDTKTIFTQPPPKFGHDLLKHFAIDPDYINLNHGSYGSTPLVVLKAAQDLLLEIESNPDLFHRLTMSPRVISAREQIAKFIGAKTDEVVFTGNASMAMSTVLRNIEWEEDDSILITNTTYPSFHRTAQYLSNVIPHPKFEVLTLNFPLTHEEILTRFREKVRSLPPGKHRVAVIDAIVSGPGVLMPWERMVKICAEEGVLSLIDAAHAIGQQVGLDLTEAKPDFWFSNLHKWLYVKRTCAALYIPERNRHIIKSSIPTSYAYRPLEDRTVASFVEQFAWNGTIDFTPPLSIPTAIAFREWIGGEESINNYCHTLALQGGRRLAEILKTRVMDPQGDLTMNMVNVQLPLPGTDVLPFTLELNLKIQNRLLRDFKVYSAHLPHNGVWWTRCSAQTYNEISDFEKVGEAWLQVCEEIVREYNLPPYQSEIGIQN
ncbi:Pyridoxal phosphate-dependent transferase [Amanita muscaria]